MSSKLINLGVFLEGQNSNDINSKLISLFKWFENSP